MEADGTRKIDQAAQTRLRMCIGPAVSSYVNADDNLNSFPHPCSEQALGVSRLDTKVFQCQRLPPNNVIELQETNLIPRDGEQICRQTLQKEALHCACNPWQAYDQPPLVGLLQAYFHELTIGVHWKRKVA